jgi:hypothetical protein
MRVARCQRQGRYACGSAWYTYGTGTAGASLPYGALTVSLAWLSPSPRSVPVPGLSVRRPPGPIRVSVRAKPSHASPGTLVPWPRANRGGRLVSPSKRRPTGYGLQLIPSVRALVHVHGSLARWAVAACPDCPLTIPRLRYRTPFITASLLGSCPVPFLRCRRGGSLPSLPIRPAATPPGTDIPPRVIQTNYQVPERRLQYSLFPRGRPRPACPCTCLSSIP